MITAVMQPYLFPYIGYYQLVYSSDNFVLYDDVTFINRGYINRNNILMNGKAFRFTIPVPSASQNKLIKELNFSFDVKKVLKTICQSYSKSPFFEETISVIENVLTYPDRSITAVCEQGIIQVFDYLEITKDIYLSSNLHYDRTKNAALKLVEITKSFDSDHYVNSIGGQHLYDKQFFREQGLRLSFIKPNEIKYSQSNDIFVPNLSIIDVLMWNSVDEVRDMLGEYKLL